MATTDKKDEENLRAYKFRLDPNQAQTTALYQQSVRLGIHTICSPHITWKLIDFVMIIGRDAMMRISPTQILKKNLMRLPKKINAISS